ncbi:hypothetical protein [Streptomyces pactum]|uniref:hypothetical protein n=1 Tax=Streptomyces pactum TaxID=68249 RepID=UPI0027DB53C7|nr:hypothetical protein [Streptomyces pactum]
MLLAGVVWAAALTLSGCGGGGETQGVASARDGGAPKGGSADRGELAEYIEGRRAWVACLRKEGVEAPDPDAKGRVDLGDARLVKSDPKTRRALEKCADLAPPVPESLEKLLQPELTAREKETNKRFSKCMQDNGAPDFPDVAEDGRIEDVVWDQTSAGAKRATRHCNPIIGLPADPGPGKG